MEDCVWCSTPKQEMRTKSLNFQRKRSVLCVWHMFSFPSFCLHRSIKVLFDEIAVILCHHPDVKHLDVVLISIGFAVIDTTL